MGGLESLVNLNAILLELLEACGASGLVDRLELLGTHGLGLPLQEGGL